MTQVLTWVKDFGIESLMLFTAMSPYLLIGFFFAGICHVYFPSDFIFKHLGKNNFSSSLKAALVGVPIPLCSCGVIPAALTLRKHKASLGATLSFLVSTPQTGIDSIIATGGLMGPVFMFFRPIAAMVMGVVGGVTGNIFLADVPANEVAGDKSCCNNNGGFSSSNWFEKLKHSIQFAYKDFLDEITVHLILGLFLAGAIAAFVPDSLFVEIGQGLKGMLVVLVVSIPMYVCATASIPVALVMLAKGASPGVAFVFLAAGPVSNMASITIVNNMLGKKFTILYLAVISIGAILMGLLLDGLYAFFGWDALSDISDTVVEHQMTPIGLMAGIIMFILVALSLKRILRNKKIAKRSEFTTMKGS
ncbi:SO_0444 family Cu/Zn efflux transporter [PVC group bacterium]|nr:SO_0444 family Cu/Zn efflux transporter [PVC group bacterium]